MARSSLRPVGLRSRMTIAWIAIVALAGMVLFLLLHWGEREQRAAEDRLSTHRFHDDARPEP